MQIPSRRHRYANWLISALLMALIWSVLSGDAASWIVGIPTILLGMLAFHGLRRPEAGSVAVRRVPGFALWFLWHSFRGGIDVARRALHPGMPLNPGFVHYKLTLAPGPARIFFINCVSLLPGSLSADIHRDELILHALDIEAGVLNEVRDAERRVQRLYGIT